MAGALCPRAMLLCVQPEDAERYEPEELMQLGPRNLSFWIASNFRETPQQQQILLQVRHA